MDHDHSDGDDARNKQLLAAQRERDLQMAMHWLVVVGMFVGLYLASREGIVATEAVYQRLNAEQVHSAEWEARVDAKLDHLLSLEAKSKSQGYRRGTS